MALSLCVRVCARICLCAYLFWFEGGASSLEFVLKILYSALPETSASEFSRHDAL